MPSKPLPHGDLPLNKRVSLAEAWAEYEHAVLPKEASDVQKVETKRAWYAGAAAIFGMMTSSLDEDLEPTDLDMLYVEGIWNELRFFARQIANGKA